MTATDDADGPPIDTAGAAAHVTAEGGGDVREEIARFLAERAFDGTLARGDARRLAARVETVPLAAGERWRTPAGDEAAVVLVIEGLVVVEADGEARGAGRADGARALDAGAGFALRARRDPAATASVHAVRPSLLVRLAESVYRAVADEPVGVPDADPTAGGAATPGTTAWGTHLPEGAERIDAPPMPPFDPLLASLAPAPGTASAEPDPVGLADGARAPRRGAELHAAIDSLMTAAPVTVGPEEPAAAAARLMHERRISCVPVVDGGRLVGIVTEADMTARVVAARASPDVPIGRIMTPRPWTLAPGATVFELLALLVEHGVAHVPVVEGERLVGIVTQTDLVRRQSASPVYLVRDIAGLDDVAAIAERVARVPELVRVLVDGGARPDAVGHVVTGVADAVTRRLLGLAEAALEADGLGPAPVPWCWAACGSQGRREQTGLTDQDNALVLDDAYDPARDGPWFERFARHVTDGLDACGYVYCPGDMMASVERWRAPVSAWRARLLDWIERPVPEARLLASVMFDLRAVAGEASLLEGPRREALDASARNTLFVAHMTRQSLGLRPAIGLFGRLATERTGEHRHRLDLKHRGTAPIVDLARLHALATGSAALGTAERLGAGLSRRALAGGDGGDDPGEPLAGGGAGPAPPVGAGGGLSESARLSLLDAWETIAAQRLRLQADQARAGLPPGNHVDPDRLTRAERERLRDALGAVRRVQSALESRAVGS